MEPEPVATSGATLKFDRQRQARMAMAGVIMPELYAATGVVGHKGGTGGKRGGRGFRAFVMDTETDGLSKAAQNVLDICVIDVATGEVGCRVIGGGSGDSCAGARG